MHFYSNNQSKPVNIILLSQYFWAKYTNICKFIYIYYIYNTYVYHIYDIYTHSLPSAAVLALVIDSVGVE